MERHGEVYCILLLDNYSAHNVSKDKYSRYIIILFLPPRVTSWHQPADMGMIASLKVGYRVKMSSGMKGFDYGGKATVLDAMKILQQLWEGDHKYAYSHSIAHYWHKAHILPALWNADLNNTLVVNRYVIRTNKYHLYNAMNESYYY